MQALFITISEFFIRLLQNFQQSFYYTLSNHPENHDSTLKQICPFGQNLVDALIFQR